MAAALLTLASLALGAVFLSSAVWKAMHPNAFRRSLTAYGLRGISLLAVGVPAIEAIVAMGLLAGPWRQESAAIAAALLAAFTGVMAYVLVTKGAVPCGCGGLLGSEPVGWSSVLRNFMLLGTAFSLMLLAGPVHLAGLNSVVEDPSSVASMVWTAGGVVILGASVAVGTLQSERGRGIHQHQLRKEVVHERFTAERN